MPKSHSSSTPRLPKLCLHRASGRAVVRLGGRDHYLGDFGSPEAQRAYDELIARWLSNGRRSEQPNAEAISVSEVILAYVQHAETAYRDNDRKQASEVAAIKAVLRIVRKLYGSTPAAGFGPKALKTCRDWMVENTRWCRNVINKQVSRVRRAFRWAVEEELIPANVYHGLLAVQPLRKGLPGVRERKKVRPVDPAAVEAILAFLPEPVAAMVKLELLCGARPSEVCIIRTRDVDTSGDVWFFRPARHKTEHHDQERVIALGPQAQAVLRPWLRPDDPHAYLFSPAVALDRFNARRRENRRTPMTPSQARRTAKAGRKRPPRARYDRDSYAHAIVRACDRAFPPPAELARQKVKGKRGARWETVAEWKARLGASGWAALERWRKEHRWGPNRLRHAHGTMVRREYGLEAAQVVLGHARADVTQTYAQRDLALAERVAREVG